MKFEIFHLKNSLLIAGEINVTELIEKCYEFLALGGVVVVFSVFLEVKLEIIKIV